MTSISKILYLSANCSYSHTSLAYGQLANFTKAKIQGFEWQIHECTTKDNVNETVSEILKRKPDILLSTVYIFNRCFINEVIIKIKLLLPKLKIILGGPEFLGCNKTALTSEPEIDFIFRGDESSFYLYLEHFKTKNINLITIPGICYIDEHNSYIDNGTAQLSESLDSLPSPYSEETISSKKPFMQIETSRGCYSKCSFCTSSLSKCVKLYSIERIISDLTILRKFGYKEIRVLDRTFNLPSPRACELLRVFIEEFPEMKFHLEFEPDKLTDDVLAVLKNAPYNKFHIEAGVQTFHKESLEYVKRKTNTETTLQRLKVLTSLGNIEIHADLIYGLPFQTSESIYQDLNTLIEIDPEEIQIEVLKVLPGTKIKEQLSNIAEYSPVPPYEILSTTKLSLPELINFSYLSKIIDCYYNHSELKIVFRYAAIKDKNFLHKFLNLTAKTFSFPEKPSIKTRFNLLLKYAKLENNLQLNEAVIFTAFKMGFFNIAENRVELIKKEKIENYLNKYNTVIFSDSKELLNKPVYLAKLDCNIGETLYFPKSLLVKKETKYLFRLSLGGLSKKVSEIRAIL